MHAHRRINDQQHPRAREAEPLLQHGAKVVADKRELAGCTAVFTMLGTTAERCNEGTRAIQLTFTEQVPVAARVVTIQP